MLERVRACWSVLQCVAACCMCCRVLLCVAAHHTSCSLNTISGGIGCCARPAIVAFSESYKKTHTRTRTYARARRTHIYTLLQSHVPEQRLRHSQNHTRKLPRTHAHTRMCKHRCTSCRNELRCTHRNILQHIATRCNTLQRAAHTATRCNTQFLQKSAEVHTLQHTATHCNTLQHAATRCNTLQHAVTHCSCRN